MKEEIKIEIKVGDRIYFKDDYEKQVVVVKVERDKVHETYDWLSFVDVETGQKDSVPNYRVFAYKPNDKGKFIDVYWHDGRGYGGWLSTEKI